MQRPLRLIDVIRWRSAPHRRGYGSSICLNNTLTSQGVNRTIRFWRMPGIWDPPFFSLFVVFRPAQI